MLHFSVEKTLFLPSWPVIAEVPSKRSLQGILLFCEPSEVKALKLPMGISLTLFVSHSVSVHVQVPEMGPSCAAFSGKVEVLLPHLLDVFPLPLDYQGAWSGEAVVMKCNLKHCALSF